MKRWTTCVATLTILAVGMATATQGSYAADGSADTKRDRSEPGRISLHDRLGLSAAERLVLKDVVRDADGTVHQRFDRTYKGLPVIGGDLLVHRAAGGRITVDWASEADLSEVGSAEPRVAAAAASRVAARTTELRSHGADAELVVYAVGDQAALAWRAVARGEHARELVFVDARSGERIAGWSDIHDARGKGRTLYSGEQTIPTVKVSSTRYLLRDPSRGNHRVFDAQNGDPNQTPTGILMKDRDNIWGNFKTSSRQSAAADVAYGHRVTWDMYKQTFGRNGIRNNGTTPRSFVHQGVNFENAYFDGQCYCMVYGDGGSTFRPLVSIDVVAHEMSHGTTEATAGLIYFGESGGLNEASSDIFGTIAEFYARNAKDRADYFIGEKVVKVAPNYLRRMDNPKLDGVSYNCWSSTMGADDVHYTSGPANHWFYLLAEGSGPKTINGRNHNSPTCNGKAIAGIGRGQAGKIWYRALNVYMLSTTNYMGARDATIRAARDLHGANSSQCKRVVAAWNAVKAPVGRWGCSGTPPTLGGNTVGNPGFESGSNGVWSESPNNPSFDIITDIAGFSNNCSSNPTPFLGFFPRTGSWYAFLNGYGSTATDELSQSVAVPNSATAKLRFWVLIETCEASGASAFDTLDVSVDDGAGPDVLATYSNADANNTYTQRTLDLSAYAGETVTLAFVGEEDFAGATVFLIDDVSVTPR